MSHNNSNESIEMGEEEIKKRTKWYFNQQNQTQIYSLPLIVRKFESQPTNNPDEQEIGDSNSKLRPSMT